MVWYRWRRRPTPRRQSPPAQPAPAPPVAPQPFRSSHYGYRLLLPLDWQVVSEGSAGPCRPPVDVFACRAGEVRLSIWNMPSTQRVLPPVPLNQRVFTLPLPDGQPVPFVAYTGAPASRVCLEGCWLQHGRRWLLDLQVPADQVADAADLVRPVWSSLQVED